MKHVALIGAAISIMSLSICFGYELRSSLGQDDNVMSLASLATSPPPFTIALAIFAIVNVPPAVVMLIAFVTLSPVVDGPMYVGIVYSITLAATIVWWRWLLVIIARRRRQ